MSARATLDVEAPVLTGEPFRVAVVVETTSSRTTRGVTLLLRGFTILQEQGHKPYQLSFGSWTALLAGTERVEPGTRRFEGTLALPADAPPTGEGVMDVWYELDARVQMEFPWVFDLTDTRRLAVARPVQRERPAPRSVSVSGVGRGSDPFFAELSLDDTSFAPGEAVSGELSLGNIGDKRVDAAVVALLPLRPELAGTGDVSVFKSLVAMEEGGAVRFSILLSKAAALSFPSDTLNVEQAVVLRIDGSSAECRIPIVIDNFAPREGALAHAPPLGRQRWRVAWGDEGSRAGLALEGRDLTLYGTLAGAVEARVEPQGTGVHGALTWESLGVSISVRPHGLLPGGVSFDDVDPAFAARFVARGPDPAAVRAALGPELRKALLAFDEAELDDAGAEVASAESAREPEELRRFLAALEGLAEALVAGGLARRGREETSRGPYR